MMRRRAERKKKFMQQAMGSHRKYANFSLERACRCDSSLMLTGASIIQLLDRKTGVLQDYLNTVPIPVSKVAVGSAPSLKFIRGTYNGTARYRTGARDRSLHYNLLCL